MRKLIAVMILAVLGCGPYYAVSERPADGVVLVSTPSEKPDDMPITDGCCGDDCQCCDQCPCKDEPSPVQADEVWVEDPVTGTLVQGSTVVLQSLPNCPPCVRWWNQERPKWEGVRWSVVKANRVVAKSVPSFRIYDAKTGRWYQYDGYLTVEAGKRLLSR